MNCSVFDAVRLCTAVGTPRRAMLRARFAPITARPVTPISLPIARSLPAFPRQRRRADVPARPVVERARGAPRPRRELQRGAALELRPGRQAAPAQHRLVFQEV